MKHKLLVAAILAALIATFTMVQYEASPHLSWEQCMAHQDAAMDASDPFQYQPNCDGYTGAATLLLGFLPLLAVTFWAMIRYGGWLLDKLPVKAWRFDPNHYKVAKGCGVCNTKPVRIALFAVAMFVGVLSVPVLPFGMVRAQVETAPTLTWTDTFIENAVTYPSTAYDFGATFARDGGNGTCSTAGNHVIQIEYATGNIYVALTSGNGATERSQGALLQINSGTGATTNSHGSSASTFASAICGLAVDQRGRVYFQAAPCDVTKQIESAALSTSGLNILKLFSRTEVCGAGNTTTVYGPVTDSFSAVSSNATRFMFVSDGDSGNGYQKSYNSSAASTATYTNLCSGTTTSPRGMSLYRDDGVLDDKSWYIGTSAGNFVSGWKPSTCSGLGGGTSGDTAKACTVSKRLTPNNTLDCFVKLTGDTTNLYVLHLDPTDNSGAFTQNVTTTDIVAAQFPDPLNDGLNASMALQPVRAFTDADENQILCGTEIGAVGGTNQYAYMAKYNATYILQWNVTVQISGTGKVAQGLVDCDLGASGEFVLAFTGDDTTTNHAHLRRYCCNSAGVRLGTSSFSQISVPTTTSTPNPGTVDAGAAFVTLAAGSGFGSASGKFLFGFFLMIVFMAIGAALLKGIGNNGLAGGGVIVIGLGEGFFNVLIGLWDAIYTILIVLVGAAIVVLFVRKMFGSSGGGQAG